MPRLVPAVLTVLGLAAAPALAGCGDDEETVARPAPTTSPAVTTTSPSTTAPVPTSPAPDDPASPSPPDGTTTLEAPGSDPPPSAPTVTEVQRPAEPLRCPSAGPKGSGGRAGDFDARELLGLTTARARALATRNGCLLRVVNRDGQDLIRTMDLSNARVNVTETDGRVVALNGIG